MDYRKLKEKVIRKFCLSTWRIWEFFGLHIIPNHFYWPIQDSRKFKSYDFDSTFPLDGISFKMEEMNALLHLMGGYSDEYSAIHNESGYCKNGDGAILYGILRELQPKKIIEVGSGYSTSIMAAALLKNSENGITGDIISIEPYPKKVLTELDNRSGNITLIKEKVENVEESVFKSLESGDVLFIDSSHVVDIANDVHFLYLRILPQIPVGVIIHIHDIRFPYEYPKDWIMDERKHWAEQYLLHMFLAFNDSFEIIFASNYVCQNNRVNMAENLIGLHENGDGWPGSFWIRRIK